MQLRYTSGVLTGLALVACYIALLTCKDSEEDCCSAGKTIAGYATTEVVLGVYLSLMAACGGSALLAAVHRRAMVAKRLPGSPLAFGAPAAHGGWRRFTLRRAERGVWGPVELVELELDTKPDKPVLRGETATCKLALTLDGDEVRGVVTAKQSGRRANAYLTVLTHWSRGRRPGLYGTVHDVGKIQLRVRDDALLGAADPVYSREAHVLGNGLEAFATGVVALGVLLLALAIAAPWMAGVGEELTNSSMPPGSGGLWAPGLGLAFGALMLARGAGPGSCVLMAAVPVGMAAIGMQLTAAAIIENADACGPGGSGNANGTLVERLCDDDLAYACVVATEWSGTECDREGEWEAWCAGTTAAGADGAAWEADAPAAFRAVAGLTAAGLVMLTTAAFIGINERRSDNGLALPTELVERMRKEARHGELVAELSSSGTPGAAAATRTPFESFALSV